MAKIQIVKPIVSTGLAPARADGLSYKTNTPNVTVSLVLKSIHVTHKEDAADSNDSIRIIYVKRYFDADGEQMGEKSEIQRDWHIKDEGALWEYDTYEWNLYDQADIDDPLNAVTMNVDGIHIDSIIIIATGESIDPLQTQGAPDLLTGVELVAEKDPLSAVWMTNWGAEILAFIAPLILAKEGY